MSKLSKFMVTMVGLFSSVTATAQPNDGVGPVSASPSAQGSNPETALVCTFGDENVLEYPGCRDPGAPGQLTRPACYVECEKKQTQSQLSGSNDSYAAAI